MPLVQDDLPTPGLYRHFKGAPYWVHRITRNATNVALYAPLVQYEALYPRLDDFDDGLRAEPGHFNRRVEEFIERVPWPDGVMRPRWVKQAVLAPLLADHVCPCGAPADVQEPYAGFRCDGHLGVKGETAVTDHLSPIFLRIQAILASGLSFTPEAVAEKVSKLGLDWQEALDAVHQLAEDGFDLTWTDDNHNLVSWNLLKGEGAPLPLGRRRPFSHASPWLRARGSRLPAGSAPP